MAKALADLIGSGLADMTRRVTWWDNLPQEARSELTDVRRRFQAGEYGPRVKALTVARALIPHCEARGWKVGDARRLSEWLRENA